MAGRPYTVIGAHRDTGQTGRWNIVANGPLQARDRASDAGILVSEVFPGRSEGAEEPTIPPNAKIFIPHFPYSARKHIFALNVSSIVLMVGGILMVGYAFNMKTYVVNDLDMGAVHNIGLLNDRTVNVAIGAGLFLAGTICRVGSCIIQAIKSA